MLNTGPLHQAMLTKLEEVHDCVALLPAMQHRVIVLERLLRALTTSPTQSPAITHTPYAACTLPALHYACVPKPIVFSSPVAGLCFLISRNMVSGF